MALEVHLPELVGPRVFEAQGARRATGLRSISPARRRIPVTVLAAGGPRHRAAAVCELAPAP